jgi:alkanesulfonate monooxygenase SsuD/methylene tetrahydromethanopterin reductase-like flavin-dependent oxidoreductase (luciferase family)
MAAVTDQLVLGSAVALVNQHHPITLAKQAEFHGEYIDFDPIWCWPKPAYPTRVLIGGTGPKVLDRVLSHGDGWLPIRVRIDEFDALAGRIEELRARAAVMGRARPTVTVFGAIPDAAAMDMYAGAGADRVLFTLTDQDGPDAAASTFAELDQFTGLEL